MPRKLVLKKGEKVGAATYLSEAGKNNSGRRICKFKCVCGRQFVSLLNSVRSKVTQSCGCRRTSPGCKLNSKQAMEIRGLIWEQGETLQHIADKYKVSVTTIFQIKIEKTYKNLV